MWRNASFKMVGVALTLLGVVVLGFHWTLMHATGVVTHTGTLLWCFPLCGLFWDWPPDPAGFSFLLLVVCVGGHWVTMGWALDAWLVRRQRGGVESPSN